MRKKKEKKGRPQPPSSKIQTPILERPENVGDNREINGGGTDAGILDLWCLREQPRPSWCGATEEAVH